MELNTGITLHLARRDTGKNKQWAMVGDTFIVGCKIPDTILFPEFNKNNQDIFKCFIYLMINIAL